jgi:MoxR-like ATPase
MTFTTETKISINALDQLSIPAIDNNFMATDEFSNWVLMTQALLANGSQTNTLLVGPAGCGKTKSAEQLAARLKMRYLHLNMATIREASMLFGTKEVEGGKTYFRETLFIKAIEAGGCVILLDEINRTVPAATNTLLSCMDGSSVWVDDLQRQVTVAPNVVFIGAANIGASYSGTFKLDRAIDNRFHRRIEVSYLSVEDETNLLETVTGVGQVAASRLVKIADHVRQEFNQGKSFSEDISTRVLLSAARDFAAMESIRPGSGPESLKATIGNRFSAGASGGERSSLAMLIDGQFASWAEEINGTSNASAEDSEAGQNESNNDVVVHGEDDCKNA